MFVCSPPVPLHAARDVAEAAVRSKSTENAQVSTWRDDLVELREWQWELAKSARDAMEAALLAAPTAGPETAFRSRAIEILQAGFDIESKEFGEEAAKIAKAYWTISGEESDDERPLDLQDRVRLRELLSRYLQLSIRAHPCYPWSFSIE